MLTPLSYRVVFLAGFQMYSEHTAVHFHLESRGFEFIIQRKSAHQPGSTFGSFPNNFQASCKNEYALLLQWIHLQDRMIMKRKCFQKTQLISCKPAAQRF